MYLTLTDMILASVRPRTYASYKSAAKHLLRYWADAAQPLTVSLYLQFLADAYDAHVGFATVQHAHAWLVLQELIHYHANPITASRVVKKAITGYKFKTREWPKKTVPLTWKRIQPLLAVKDLSTEGNVSFLYHVLLAYVGLLRWSEAESILQTGDSSVSETQKGFLFYFAKSKNDRMDKGVQVFIPSSSLPKRLCKIVPVICAKLKEGVRFPLSHTVANNMLRVQLGDPNVRFHGNQHGRVKDLLADGVPKTKIKEWGRWFTKAAFSFYT